MSGFENDETQLVALWIDNTQETLDHWLNIAERAYIDSDENEYLDDLTRAQFTLARFMEEEYEGGAPDLNNDFYQQLFDAAFERVNWRELANHYLEKLKDTHGSFPPAGIDNALARIREEFGPHQGPGTFNCVAYYDEDEYEDEPWMIASDHDSQTFPTWRQALQGAREWRVALDNA